MSSSRPYQIVIFGATGFTGQLVAQYFYQRFPPGAEATHGINWAMAGRDADKLERVRDSIGAEGIDCLVADASKRSSLQWLCAQTEVVCTTVGPYAKHGDLLVAACVAQQTDYCDLSGEVPWMRRMIEAHHQQAREAGVRIVHSCGFDSIPSDIGVLHLQKAAKARFGEFCESVDMLLAEAKGSFSGGTYASLNQVLAEAGKSDKTASLLMNPYSLNFPAPDGRCDTREQREAGFSDSFQTYTAPFVMAGINTRIVRRSHALAGFPYGNEFCYSEAIATGEGLGGRLTAKLTAFGIGTLMSNPTLASALMRLAPKPGEGPNEKEREAGYFSIRFSGRTASGQTIKTSVRSDRDPGYGSTCRMLTESAVALLNTRHENREGGVLTPALAIGPELLEALQEHAVLNFQVH